MRLLSYLAVLWLVGCTCAENTEPAEAEAEVQGDLMLATGLLTWEPQGAVFAPCRGIDLVSVVGAETALDELEQQHLGARAIGDASFVRLRGTWRGGAHLRAGKVFDAKLTLISASEVRDIREGDCGLTGLAGAALPSRDTIGPVVVEMLEGEGDERDGLLTAGDATPGEPIGGGLDRFQGAMITAFEATTAWCASNDKGKRRAGATIRWDVFDKGGERFLGRVPIHCANARTLSKRHGAAEATPLDVRIRSERFGWQIHSMWPRDAVYSIDLSRRLASFEGECIGERCPELK